MFQQGTNLKFSLFSYLYRIFLFILILAFVFAPIGDLAYKYLPKNVADQIAKVSLEVQTVSAHTDDIFVFITVASNSELSNSWTVPADWNPASNSIEVIGGGGGGGDGTNSGTGGAGGGGYSRINNLSLTSGGSVVFSVGAGGVQGGAGARGAKGGKTFFNAANFAACTDSATCVKADGGEGSLGNGSITGAIGGQISTTASAVGTTTYTGGDGGTGCGGDSGGGGGGAGGPKGNGATGGNGGGDTSPGVGGGGGGNGGGTIGSNASVACGSASGNQAGGDGGDNAYDSNSGGAGGNAADGGVGTNGGGGGGGEDSFSGGNGGAGDEWVTGYGSGGGGGGGGDEAAGEGSGGQGGLYGGGGGGGEGNATLGLGAGADGIIVVKYTPRAVQSHFQWFNDDYALDSMDNLASISAEDIKASGSEALSINDTSRLRIQIANQKNFSGPSFTNDKFRLEFTRAGTSCGSPSAGWTWRTMPLAYDAGIASDAFDIETSSQITPDGASTSVSLLTAPKNADLGQTSMTFTNGFGLDARATSGYQTIPDNQFTEIEWAFKPNANANTSADYCFRAGWITDDSTTPDTRASISYSKIASASVQAAATVTFTQNDYEWFYNVDDVQPTGSINGIENKYAEIGTVTVIPRLRMNLTVGASNLSASTEQFDLQYSAHTSMGPWTDVGTGAWIFKDNGLVADPENISSALVSTTDVVETYHESNPTSLNPNGANNGQEIEYDWSLDPANATPGVIYYFRMVKSNGDSLDGYDNYPSIRITVNVSHGGGGGASGGPGDNGNSGGNGSQGGGNPGGGHGGSEGGESGGNGSQGGGNPDGGGGGSPVMFDWRFWFDKRISGLYIYPYEPNTGY